MRDYIKSKYIIIFLAVILTHGYSSAQNEEGPTVYKIVSISTEGNNFYDSKTIISNSGLKVGTEIAVPSEVTGEAIQRLWNLNLFSDIEIVVDKKIGSDAYLLIKVKELPRLDQITFSGNDDFNDKDLLEKIPLTKGQVVTPQSIKDIENTINKMYIDDGYPFTDVKVKQLINSFNEIRLKVEIDEGSKVSVQEILFEGNKHIKSGDLRGAMDETSQKVWWKFWDNARFNRENYEKDKKLIVDFYREKGYRDAFIVDDTLIYGEDDDMFIGIKVYEGPKYTVRNITFTGNTIYSDSLLFSKLDFKKGDIYNEKKFDRNLRGNESQTDIAALYRDNGYLGFQAEKEEKDIGNHKLDITVHITENNQFRVGLINFKGNSKTQDKILRRELFTLPGQYFNQSDLVRSLRALSALNYFNPETLSYDFSPRDDSTVDLAYTVEEKSSDQLNASVGWSQTFGLSGSVGVTFNNFDITEPLSGGAGQILSFQWDFGQAGTFRTFSIGFTEPWLYNTPTLLGINLFDDAQNYTYSLRETGATLSFGRRFRFPDDYFRGDWFLKVQRTDVVNGGGLYPTGLRSQVSIGQTITRNSTDNPIFPSIGTKVALSGELAGANIIGSISFHKEIFSAEAYNRLDNSGKLVLYSSYLIESISSLSSDNYVPPNELLFMGGNGLAYNTIALRGYDDQSVGPVDSIRQPIGGRVLMKYGVELRYALTQDPIPIYLSLFSEAGNVWPTFKTSNFFDLRRSVGFGVRLVMPAVGVIGFDLGYGFDRKIVNGNDPALLFHFQFGRGF